MEQKKMRGDKASALVIGAGLRDAICTFIGGDGEEGIPSGAGASHRWVLPPFGQDFSDKFLWRLLHESHPPAFCPIYECHLHDNIELLPYSEVSGIEGGQGF
jgi:hypothetical protein